VLAGVITKPVVSNSLSLSVEDVKNMVENLLIEDSVCGARCWDHVLANALYLCMMVATEDGVGDRRPRIVDGYFTRLKDVALTISKKHGVIHFKADILSKPTKGYTS
jgi:hypothetical protein